MAEFNVGDIVCAMAPHNAYLRKVVAVDDCVRLDDGTEWTLTGDPVDKEKRGLFYTIAPAGEKLTAAYYENAKKREVSA